LIGLPVAWYLGQQYLERFSERIELQWWHYALPILVLVLIMLATVGSVVWRAARNNPVEALKYE
jgi:putative ABC transport system permease protein